MGLVFTNAGKETAQALGDDRMQWLSLDSYRKNAGLFKPIWMLSNKLRRWSVSPRYTFLLA